MTDRLVPMSSQLVSNLYDTPVHARAVVSDRFNAAVEPVTRRRCTVHGSDRVTRYDADRCWAWSAGEGDYDDRCEFVDELCVPKPEADA